MAWIALRSARPGLDRDADPRVGDGIPVRLMVILDDDAMLGARARDGFLLVTRSAACPA